MYFKNRSSEKHKILSNKLQIIIITGVFMIFLVAYLPHFLEKKAYQDTSAVTYDQYDDQTGYPAGDGFTDIKSAKDTENLNNFTITVDVENLHPTHKYKTILSKSYCNVIMRYLNNTHVNGIGQYYTVVLESGEEIIVFLDDFALDIPRHGVITLPVSRRVNVLEAGATLREIQIEHYIAVENTNWYVDATGDWRLGEEAQTAQKNRKIAGTLVFLAVAVIETIFFKARQRKEQLN